MKQNISKLFKSPHNLLTSSFRLHARLVFTCSKSTAETLEPYARTMFEI